MRPKRSHTAASRPRPSAEDRGGKNVIYTYDDTGEPSHFDLSDQLLTIRAIDRAVATINELLADDYVPALVQFVWEDFSTVPGRQNVLALANATYDSKSLTSIVNSLENLYTPNDTDPYETALQVNSPRPNVSYKSNLSDTNTTNSALITSIQRMKLFLGIQPTQVITINSAQPFDLDPSDGISAGEFDLTGVLIHELIHLLGFTSFTEGVPVNGMLTHWDTFRLNASDSSVSPPEFSGDDRELRSSEAAIGVLQLNGSFQLHLYRLSTGSADLGGDGRQASHWRDDEFDDDYIGIMDPTFPPGMNVSSLTLSSTYFTIADVRALDVMGYDIDVSDYTPFPTITAPVLSFPVADAVLDPALDVAFSWNAGNEIEADLLVYDLGTTIATTEPVLVYRENGITGGSTTVTAAAIGLQPGHRYQWNIGARYALGFATSQPETFIAACHADRNGDGVVNFFDLTDFLADHDAMHPSADLAPPYGVWNFFDLHAYQALYAAGCP